MREYKSIMAVRDDAQYQTTDTKPTYMKLKPFLNALSSDYLHIRKYYEDDEKRIKYVPDILDSIDSEIEKLEGFFDAFRKSAMSGEKPLTSERMSWRSPNDIKARIALLEDYRQRVVDGDNDFYIFSAGDALTSPKFGIVELGTVTMYHPVWDANTKKYVASEPIQLPAMRCLNDIIMEELNWIHIGAWAEEDITEYYAFCVEDIDECCNERCTAPRHICKTCGSPFVILNSEREWFANKGFKLPVNCKKCRKSRKQDRKA